MEWLIKLLGAGGNTVTQAGQAVPAAVAEAGGGLLGSLGGLVKGIFGFIFSPLGLIAATGVGVLASGIADAHVPSWMSSTRIKEMFSGFLNRLPSASSFLPGSGVPTMDTLLQGATPANLVGQERTKLEAVLKGVVDSGKQTDAEVVAALNALRDQLVKPGNQLATTERATTVSIVAAVVDKLKAAGVADSAAPILAIKAVAEDIHQGR